MASDLKDRLKKAVTEAAQEPSRSRQTLLRHIILNPVITIALLVLAGVAYAGYRYYFIPFGKIVSPASGAQAARIIEVGGYTKNIPLNRKYVWLTVDAERLDLCWPKRQIYKCNQPFKIKIHEGGPPGEVVVSLYAVDRDTHVEILEWIDDCRHTKTETGFRMIPARFKLDSVKLSAA